MKHLRALTNRFSEADHLFASMICYWAEKVPNNIRDLEYIVYEAITTLRVDEEILSIVAADNNYAIIIATNSRWLLYKHLKFKSIVYSEINLVAAEAGDVRISVHDEKDIVVQIDNDSLRELFECLAALNYRKKIDVQSEIKAKLLPRLPKWLKDDFSLVATPLSMNVNQVQEDYKVTQSLSDTQADGFVYILFNPSLRQDMLKIGMTTRSPQERAKEISTGTGIPTEYIVVYEHAVSDCKAAERAIHAALDYYRVNSKREFFKIPLSEAVKKVSEIAASYS